MSMGKILVADDDQNIAELLRLYLEKEGYTVVLAADGEQAIERFNAGKSRHRAAGHHDAKAGRLAGVQGHPQKIQLPDHHGHCQGRNL